MRKLLLLFLFLGCVGFSYAQEDGTEVISLGRDFFRKESIPMPAVFLKSSCLPLYPLR